MRDSFATHEVLVGVVNSLSLRRLTLAGSDVLLVADECHRLGAMSFQEALDERYVRRLGLTATFERSDERLADLMTYFGGEPVFQMGYERALKEEIVAHYKVARVGVPFAQDELDIYQERDEACRSHREVLVRNGVPSQPFGTFMKAVAYLGGSPSHPLHQPARAYLAAFSGRAEILGNAQEKIAAMASLAPAVSASRGTLVFTNQKASAAAAARVLRRSGIRAEAIDSDSSGEDREQALAALKTQDLQAVVAPRILDEGVDVPEADLGVIVATSSRKLQMIQRMGRILRRKSDQRRACFVLLYVQGTIEDPHGRSRAHEAFFDAIVPTADDVQDFTLSDMDALNAFLTDR